jgi:hypothetical protein
MFMWLNDRFPPKVKVKQEDYDALRQSVGILERTVVRSSSQIDSIFAEMDSIKKSLAAIKEGVIKCEIVASIAESQKLRRDFIEGNFVMPTNAAI